ncbi:MAG: Rieske 2Fe-2S domain-containing protein [Mycobacteriales bacterium]
MAIRLLEDREHPGGTGGGRGRWQQRRTDPAWLLLPQRIFLGGTFAYAGLDKLADETFFDPTAPTSIEAQLGAVPDTSPLRPLLGLIDQHAGAIGVLIALGEIAVGVATLLGVRSRLAAAGGALISLSLLLTVTWATRPYYYGSDIVFLVCWLPLVAFGDGGLLSLETGLARRAARRATAPDRRALLAQAAAIGAVVGLGGSAALAARIARGRPADLGAGAAREPAPGEPTTPTTGPPRAGGAGRLAAAAAVPVGEALAVTLPATGAAALLVHLTAGRFVAFQRTCTHAGCMVDISPDRRTFRCPCHGAVYDARTGRVLAGPAPAPLAPVPVRVVGPDVVTD